MTMIWRVIKKCPNCSCEFTTDSVVSCNTFGAIFYTDGYIEGTMYVEESELLTCPGCKKTYWKTDVPTLESMPLHEISENTKYHSLGFSWNGYPDHSIIEKQPTFWKNETQEKYIRIRVWWSDNSIYHGGMEYLNELTMTPDAEVDRLRKKMISILQSPMSTETEILEDLGNLSHILGVNIRYRKYVSEEYISELESPSPMSPESVANLRRLIQLLDINKSSEAIMMAEIYRELGEFDECLKILDESFEDSQESIVVTIRKLALSKKRRVKQVE